MDEVMERELDRYLGGDPQIAGWPYPMYHRWRSEHPAYRYEHGPAVVLTGYDDVHAVMADGVRISNNGYRHGALAAGVLARLPEADRALFYDVMDFDSGYLSRTDGDTHNRLRRVASRAFTPARIRGLRESIQAHVDELIDVMRQQDVAEVKGGLANQLPIRVVTDLIGVPAADRPMIWAWSEAIAGHFSLDSGTLRHVHDAIDSFRGYVHELVARLRRDDNRTHLAMVLLDGRDGERLSEEELTVMFVLLLFAGSETTTNLLGNAFLALQRHRDQWDLVTENPELIGDAVQEALRYDAPLQYLPRVALQDMRFGDEVVQAGESLIIFIGAANRDPAVFADPDRFAIRRADRGRHLALAFGPHFCLGAALARLEGEIALGTLARRFPDARLLGEQVRYGGSAMLRKVLELRTDLGPERRG
jgi:cytochrome P450